MTSLEEFKKILQYHDWTFMYADDPRDWEKGERNEKWIRKILEENYDNPLFKEAYEEEYYKNWPSHR